jgi:hypothetical protein
VSDKHAADWWQYTSTTRRGGRCALDRTHQQPEPQAVQSSWLRDNRKFEEGEGFEDDDGATLFVDVILQAPTFACPVPQFRWTRQEGTADEEWAVTRCVNTA